VGIGIVFAAIVLVLGVGLLRSKLFQSLFVVVMQSAFIIIDEDTGGDVHRVDQDKSFPDSAFSKALLNSQGDIDELTPLFCGREQSS
jgi:hypothetical protein